MERDQLIALIAAEMDAERHGRGQVEIDGWPDEDERMNQAVDFIGHDDVGEIVVEHTRMESFRKQIEDRVAIQSVFPRLGSQVPGRTDAGKFELLVRPGAMSAIKSERRRRDVERILTGWVTNNRDLVACGEILYGGHPDVRFPWALWRWLPDAARIVGPDATVVPVRHGLPDDLEERRRHRIDQVVRDKLPKLAAAAGEDRRTVLVSRAKTRT